MISEQKGEAEFLKEVRTDPIHTSPIDFPQSPTAYGPPYATVMYKSSQLNPENTSSLREEVRFSQSPIAMTGTPIRQKRKISSDSSIFNDLPSMKRRERRINTLLNDLYMNEPDSPRTEKTVSISVFNNISIGLNIGGAGENFSKMSLE